MAKNMQDGFTKEREYEIVEHTVIKNFKIALMKVTSRAAHIHSDYEVAFLLRGTATIVCDGASLEIHAPDFYVINPFYVHEIHTTQPALFLSLHVLSSFFREYYPAISGTEFEFCSGATILDYPNEPYFQRICSFALSIARHYYEMENGFSLYCAGKLNHLFYDLIFLLPHQVLSSDSQQKQSQLDERIRRINAYILNHYDEKLLLSDVAKTEGLTLAYTSHFFKQHYGMSFQDYLTQLRCEKARQLLLSTDLNLLEICMGTGFSDIKYLNKGFQKMYGMSPKELRENGLSRHDIRSEKMTSTFMRPLLPQEAQKILEKISIQGNRVIFEDGFSELFNSL